MSNLSVSCHLSGNGGANPHAAASFITAIVPPALGVLFEGQTIAGASDFATMTAPTNFNSSGGEISRVDIGYMGEGVSATSPLVEGGTAGFTVTVTDSTGAVAVFFAGPVEVQYLVRVNSVTGNIPDIDVNPIMEDGDLLSIEIAVGSRHDGTYTTLTAGDLRDGPANFPGTVGIDGDGALGTELIAVAGLWTTPTEELTLAYQWFRDGAAIDGATSPTLTVTEAEQATEVTLRVTGDDGVHAPLAVTGAAISIPGPAQVAWTPALEPTMDYRFDFTDAATFSEQATSFRMVPQGVLAGLPAVIDSSGKTNGAVGTLNGLRGYHKTGPLGFETSAIGSQPAADVMLCWLHAPGASTAANSFVVACRGSGGSGTRLFGLASGAAAGNSFGVGAGALVANVPVICILTIAAAGTSSTVRYYENGVLKATQTGVNFASIAGDIALGHYPGGATNGSYEGHLFDIAKFTSRSDGLRQMMEGYWAHAAGIALPAGHPFATTPPSV